MKKLTKSIFIAKVRKGGRETGREGGEGRGWEVGRVKGEGNREREGGRGSFD